MPDINVSRVVSSMFVHDRSQLRVMVGLRNAGGIGLPLVVGALTGEISGAVVIAIGALIAGLAGMAGTLRQRIRLMWHTTLWMSAAIFIASCLGRFDWFAILITAVSGFWIGMMVAVSPGAAQVGTFAGLGLVIFLGIPGGLMFSARDTVLACGGRGAATSFDAGNRASGHLGGRTIEPSRHVSYHGPRHNPSR